MSTPTEENINTDVPAEQQPKRRRKSGWDLPAPDNSSTSNTTLSNVQPIAQQQPHPFNLPGLPPIQTYSAHNPLLAIQTTFPMPQPILVAAPVSRIENRIYVGSMHYDLPERDIRTLFACFGTITKVDLSHDPITGRSKGFCFIEYSTPEEAITAMAMNGFEIGGRKIKVGRPFGAGLGAGAGASHLAFAAGATGLAAAGAASFGMTFNQNPMATSAGACNAYGPGSNAYGTSLQSYVPQAQAQAQTNNNLFALIDDIQRSVTSSQQQQQAVVASAAAVTPVHPVIPPPPQAAIADVVTAISSTNSSTSTTTTVCSTTTIENIHPAITPEDVKRIFTAFGAVTSIASVSAPTLSATTGVASYGCQVIFAKAEDAKTAAESMNGYNLGGLPWAVSCIHPNNK